MRTWLGYALALTLLPGPSPVSAQDDPPDVDPPGGPAITLAYVEGRAEIARTTGVTAAQAPDLLDDGDRFRTLDGRAELVLADGGTAHVESSTDLSVDGDRIRLVRGRMIVRTGSAAPLEVDTPVGLARLEPGGEYDLAAHDLDGDTTVAVLRGRASLSMAAADLPIAADDQVAIDPRGLEPRWTRWGGRRDTFTAWVDRRVAAMDAARRQQPLPPELAAYAPGFATYGQWDAVAPYGQVWFPTAAPGWRPYADGWWRYTRFGWTWIDRDPWGWPVHHFGRWGRHPARGWYWIPRRTWGPAWVGWAVEADYVGWAPLGWHSRPVVDFFAGHRLGPRDLWAGTWSVVPRGVFGQRGSLGRYYADPRRLPGPVLGGFVVQRRAPRGPVRPGRLSPAPGYGRPSPPRGNSRWTPAPGPRSNGGATAPRHGRGAGRGDTAPSGEALSPTPATGGQDRRADRRDETRPEPPPARVRDPRRAGDEVGQRPGAGGGGEPDPNRAYGRPAPAPGRAWGRPSGGESAASPRPAGAGRGGNAPAARGAGRGRGDRAGSSSTGSSSGGAGSGGRRRPR